MKRTRGFLAGLGAIALLAAACGGGGGGGGGGKIEPPVVFDKIGQTEGELNLIAWNGYVENGSNDPNYDWVTPFEDKTGCKVNVKYADTSDQMVTLMRQGGGTAYDGVSASGNASNTLIAGGDVGAVDTKLFPDFANVIGPLQPDTGTNTKHYVVDGNVYGTPYMYGPNFLMYNTEVVSPAPTSWDVTFEPTLNGQTNPYAGKITAYDDPIFIADAAVYLKAHDSDLGITDPYELTTKQLDAAMDLLDKQKPLVAKYWSLYTDEIDGFVNGSMVVGTAWPVNLSYAEADAPVDQVIPSEGVTGWADTWMISAHAKHPNCMLEWMKWAMTPKVQSEVAVWYGAAGSNVNSCDLIRTALGKDADLVDTVRYSFCGDVDFLNSLYLWKTPRSDCGDGRDDCADYSEWQRRWTQLRGA